MMPKLSGITGLAAAALFATLSAADTLSPQRTGTFFTLKGHGGPIKGIAVSPVDGRVASASFDNAVGVWDGRAPVWLDHHRAAVNAVAFVGETGLVSAGDDFALTFWNLQTGQPDYRQGHKGKIIGLAVAPDQKTVASASWDGSIGLWPTAKAPPRFLHGHTSGVNAVAFSPDNTQLYSASVDGSLRIWDIETATEKQILLRHGFGINTLILDPNQRWLAYGAVDGVTRFINPQTGAKIADFTLDRRPILSMAQTADGSVLAVGDGEGFIMLIDTKNWRILDDFQAALRGPIWALAFSKDGQNIFAGGIEDIIYSWPLADLRSAPKMASKERSFQKDPALMSNGERQFQRKCSICHSLTENAGRKAGPTLFRILNRPAGTLAGYSYSKTLQNSAIIWTEETISALFDLGPDHYIPGSKMPMQRITRPQDRTDLVNFLKLASTPQED